MKRLLSFLMLVSFLFTTSCYDDSFIREQLANHEKRISDLGTICLRINTNISSVQAVLDALQKNDYVTSMVPVTEAGKEIGYVLVFSSGKSVTIYHGKDGVNGSDGDDGKDGVTPQLKIEEDYWYVPYGGSF